MPNRIPVSKLRLLFALYKQNKIISKRRIAQTLKITRNTLKNYLTKFQNINGSYSEVAEDEKTFIGLLFPQRVKSERENQMYAFFPAIHARLENTDLTLHDEWEEYIREVPQGFKTTQFYHHYSKWLKSIGIATKPNNRWRIKSMSEEEVLQLKKFRQSVNRQKWERAVALLDAQNGVQLEIIAKKLDRSRDAVKDWIKAYAVGGFDTLFNKKRIPNEDIALSLKVKRANLIKLIHETPKLHGINRASWSLKTLSAAYREAFGESMSMTTVSEYIRAEGYSFKKARETLTSPDPLYREKLQKITTILSNLGAKEKFFSVDEFGPFAVKMKGGRVLVKKGENRTYPQFQKSKGCLICTAALELSTNQVTHFYSTKKDTEEMIRLLEVLLKEYSGQERIFFSWDAASWHASKKLHEKIKQVNELEYRIANNTPLVELAPLPASAQFLNVIESVFSGMAKGVIHNSDYQSVIECKEAIDRYFAERNTYFKEHPKRAGNKIWGKEKVKSVFSEINNCKDERWR